VGEWKREGLTGAVVGIETSMGTVSQRFESGYNRRVSRTPDNRRKREVALFLLFMLQTCSWNSYRRRLAVVGALKGLEYFSDGVPGVESGACQAPFHLCHLPCYVFSATPPSIGLRI